MLSPEAQKTMEPVIVNGQQIGWTTARNYCPPSDIMTAWKVLMEVEEFEECDARR